MKKLSEIYKGEEAAALAVLQRLRSYLDAAEPELVYFLTNTWKHQGKAITYKELREAILSGDINEELLDQWRQDYNRFVVDHLKPKWEESMKAATADMEAKYPDWYFDPMGDGVREWTETRSAEWVTSVTDTQIEGIRAVVRRAAVLEDLNVDDLARVIRPMVGLYRGQAISNLNYYENLLKHGVKENKARDLTIRDAARKQRWRAYSIARTELANAYNYGADEGIRQAQAQGYMGKTVKVWCTAEDERRCTKICKPLEGVEVGMDDDFPGISASWSTHKNPPAHPGCRCTVMYKEIEPPSKK